MHLRSRQQTPRLLASALGGAWRAAPPAPEISASELARVAPLLAGSGAGALGWWKVRRTPLAGASAGAALREAYRYQTVRAALHEREVGRVFKLLGEAGVSALLVKGWAASRLYPETGLRPSGDVDVCVRPSQLAHAAEVLRDSNVWVDLHAGFGEDERRDFEELFERAQIFRLGDGVARVPCAEDHLRLLCLHLLRHGAWRPLWLCDVAAALEARPRDFDWERFEGRDRRRARWVACALGLARELLGARVCETPLARASARLPRWLVPAVLAQWERPFAAERGTARHRAPMASYLRRPAGALRDLRNRWPGPVEATVRVGGPFNGLPRLPFQLGHGLARAAHFLAREMKK
jgi:Uncharacterised nucleotidyltransferase